MARHLYVGGDGQIIGIYNGAPGNRIHVAWEPEQAYEWYMDLRNERAPVDESGGIAISDEGMRIFVGGVYLGDSGEMESVMPEDGDEDSQPTSFRLGPKGQHFIRCAHPIHGFREFLKSWWFLDQDTGKMKKLGLVLWAGQEHYAVVCSEELWVYYLKARQLGETTIAIAYDAWVLRFRTPNARVHLVSRTEELAKRSLLVPLKRGMGLLPVEMQLPMLQVTTTIYELDAGYNDRRIAVAYPAKEPGRGETCSHLHLDEWAAMAQTSPELPAEVWASAEPTISKQGGSVHILTTGVGPTGYYADVWRNCEAGGGQLHASFIGASGSRPDYTPEWLAQKRIDMADEARFRHEYPETSQDALAGRGDVFFTTYEIDHAAQYARGIAQVGCPRERGKAMYLDPRIGRLRKRKYIKAWDIAGPGAKADLIVGTVLDITEEVWDVVEQEIYQKQEYPTTAHYIEQMHVRWPGITVIEDNETGKAVRAFLHLSPDEVEGFTTTRQSKPVILSELKYGVQAMTVKWNPDECKELDGQMRYYKLADENIKQDCVMSLAIAVHKGAEHALDGQTSGRILAVVRV